MLVGLDAISLSSWKLEPLALLAKVSEYGLEGLQLDSHELLKRDADYRTRFKEAARERGLYIELNGAGVNPRNSGRSVAEMVEAWKPLFPLAADMGASILNTCFGLYQERMMSSPSFAEQLAMTTQVLKELGRMGADYGVSVTMELHVDLTSHELRNLIETVNSPFVGVNLDTANALALMEDPVEAAEVLAPYAKTTHYKDTCVYLTDEGFNWQGGAPLGTGLVDLPAVTEMLYQANPDIHLNIEDGWGFIPIPFDDPVFLNSFTDLTAERLVRFMRFLRRGEALLRAGMHPRPDEIKSYNVPMAMASRLWHSANYARRLRDEIVARHAAQ